MVEVSARIRRLMSDYDQISKDFSHHPNIAIMPMEGDPPEKYRVTYFVNGIYLLSDGRIETLSRHEVEITLHADYPRYKPICKILTPIWHPNFRDGQICIGDIWGAGESLSDIIINIGDMIQYKSWNSQSPLSADAAQWALENKHLFPVGDVNLYTADPLANKANVEIDLYDQSDNPIPAGDNPEVSALPLDQSAASAIPAPDASQITVISAVAEAAQEFVSSPPANAASPTSPPKPPDDNDFNINADELAGVTFIPSAQLMQASRQVMQVKGRSFNFKTVFFKGILYGLIGGLLGWVISELIQMVTGTDNILSWMGYHDATQLYAQYDSGSYTASEYTMIIGLATIISTAIFTFSLSAMLGAIMGLGEGIYYGSRSKALRYCLIGFAVSSVLGIISGVIAQYLFSAIIDNADTYFLYAFYRAIGWSVMGLGVGLSIGLIKPSRKRVFYCGLGGLAGGFAGGFLFDYIGMLLGSNGTGVISRAVGIVLMGGLIGLGVGMLEQFAKAAWLKVIRGEFEGKEYLVFSGTTLIGNDGSNSIVLFKDKMVAKNHCQIQLQGSKYILKDLGSPLGTVVNGMRTNEHILRKGDSIAIGNSVLVFYTK